ncbi:MAG: SIMPL domain-containing protein [bacterium]|jgi:uncharacterized protein YggE
MKGLLRYAVIGLSLLLVAFSLIGPTGINPVQAAGEAKTLTAYGEAQITIAPDTAQITFGVENEAPTAVAALQANAAAMEKVIASLKKQGIEEKNIQTSGFSLYPNYEYTRQNNREVRVLTGYRVNNNVVIKTKQLKDLGKIIDTTVSAGANVVRSISFGIEDTGAIEKQVLAQAVKHARAKADALAAAADSRVTGILTIEETGNSGFEPLMAKRMEMEMAADMAVTPIEPGQLTLSAGVKITFTIT